MHGERACRERQQLGVRKQERIRAGERKSKEKKNGKERKLLGFNVGEVRYKRKWASIWVVCRPAKKGIEVGLNLGSKLQGLGPNEIIKIKRENKNNIIIIILISNNYGIIFKHEQIFTNQLQHEQALNKHKHNIKMTLSNMKQKRNI